VPQPHPFKATAAHEYWFIDGRMMDFAIEGHRWWTYSQKTQTPFSFSIYRLTITRSTS
jgi:hypothetical protein